MGKEFTSLPRMLLTLSYRANNLDKYNSKYFSHAYFRSDRRGMLFILFHGNFTRRVSNLSTEILSTTLGSLRNLIF